MGNSNSRYNYSRTGSPRRRGRGESLAGTPPRRSRQPTSKNTPRINREQSSMLIPTITEIKTSNICSICLTFECNRITKCTHLFCKDCINKWTNIQPTCPTCRTKL